MERSCAVLTAFLLLAAMASAALADYRAKADEAHRRKKQEAYEKSKMQYDYQYDDSFGWGYGGWGGGWHGYYRW